MPPMPGGVPEAYSSPEVIPGGAFLGFPCLNAPDHYGVVGSIERSEGPMTPMVPKPDGLGDGSRIVDEPEVANKRSAG